MSDKTEKLYIKYCRTCGAKFETQSKTYSICEICRAEEKRLNRQRKNGMYKKPKKKSSRLPIDIEIFPLVRLIDRYNEREGTHYTYGQFIELVRTKKIDLKHEEKRYEALCF